MTDKLYFKTAGERRKTAKRLWSFAEVLPKFCLSPCGMPQVQATVTFKSQTEQSLVNKLWCLDVIAYWPMSLLFGIWSLLGPVAKFSFPAVLKYSLFVKKDNKIICVEYVVIFLLVLFIYNEYNYYYCGRRRHIFVGPMTYRAAERFCGARDKISFWGPWWRHNV